MTQDKHSVFLERRAYRQRRMADGARLLPLFGAVLLCLPVFWGLSDTKETLTTYVMSFLFCAWVGLIVVAALISSRLPDPGSTPKTPKDE